MLAGILSDCKALICNQVGETPRQVLISSGLSVYESDGLISEAVTDVFNGQQPRRALPPRDCKTSCSGPGTGCG